VKRILLVDITADTYEDSAQPDLVVACPECGLVQDLPHISAGTVARCDRCHCRLTRAPSDAVAPGLLWALTALFLFLPAVLEPLFIVSAAGRIQENIVGGLAHTLAEVGYFPLGVVVALFTLLIPLLWLTGLIVVLLNLYAGRVPSWLGRLYRYVIEAEAWAMPEIFLVGGFVAYSRMRAVTEVTIGNGGLAYIGFAFAVMLVHGALDRHHVWREIMPEAETLPVDPISCPACHLVLPAEDEGANCPRCRARVLRRKPASLARTAALTIAAYLLYIPANLLPVLTVTRLGRSEDNTIFSGMMELIHLQMVPLAIIVFCASIAVPLLKLAGLTWFLIAIKRASPTMLGPRTRLYKMIDAIGRWSNIDVFMIALLTGLIQFEQLSTVLPKPGALAFAAVVILTMIASRSFDPRLMWDAAHEEKN
jgi:paraquat-inducible protein A